MALSKTDLQYIIVQAGGRGSRMERLTRNKPKALVPVNSRPLIFHLFSLFPKAKFIVIGDYRFDVLEKYLAAFCPVEYELVNAAGKKGNCAGLSAALEKIPQSTRFMLIWCDLILAEDYRVPEEDDSFIGIAADFQCRYQYRDGAVVKENAVGHGVAGQFVFSDKSVLKGVPEEGEFADWLAAVHIPFREHVLTDTREYGRLAVWEKLPLSRCRSFNRLEVSDERVVKHPVDPQGAALAEKEAFWYRQVRQAGFSAIPRIDSDSPLSMERIDGRNVYEYGTCSREERAAVLRKLVACLRSLHELGTTEADRTSYYEAYIGKTFRRLETVRELIPFAADEFITVNGRRCRNIFFHRRELEERILRYLPERFCLIHGDCTFSNILLRQDGSPVLIDPRGYFGFTELYGDPAYDWVKLYYSLVGNYDQFNLKRFDLAVEEESVTVSVCSNGWEDVEEEFFALLNGEVDRRQMLLLMAVVWLSLTTYVWEDYDSVCGAFYLGTWYFEQALDEALSCGE